MFLLSLLKVQSKIQGHFIEKNYVILRQYCAIKTYNYYKEFLHQNLVVTFEIEL